MDTVGRVVPGGICFVGESCDGGVTLFVSVGGLTPWWAEEDGLEGVEGVGHG